MRTLNTKVMTAAVQISSKYDVSSTTVITAGGDWANLERLKAKNQNDDEF